PRDQRSEQAARHRQRARRDGPADGAAALMRQHAGLLELCWPHFTVLPFFSFPASALLGDCVSPTLSPLLSFFCLTSCRSAATTANFGMAGAWPAANGP